MHPQLHYCHHYVCKATYTKKKKKAKKILLLFTLLLSQGKLSAAQPISSVGGLTAQRLDSSAVKNFIPETQQQR